MVLSLKLLFAGACFLKGSSPGVAPMMYLSGASATWPKTTSGMVE